MQEQERQKLKRYFEGDNWPSCPIPCAISSGPTLEKCASALSIYDMKSGSSPQCMPVQSRQKFKAEVLINGGLTSGSIEQIAYVASSQEVGVVRVS